MCGKRGPRITTNMCSSASIGGSNFLIEQDWPPRRCGRCPHLRRLPLLPSASPRPGRRRLGIHMTTKASPTKTAARIFQRNILATRAGKLFSRMRSFPMNPAANHCPLPKSAVWRFLSLYFHRKTALLNHRNTYSTAVRRRVFRLT